MTKVSICIPTYNNVTEVERLLTSIFCQTYFDYEVIISDDSTNDEIIQLVETKYAGRIRYYHNAVSLGHVFNWNKALSYATGEYVKIMFSDDWFTYKDSLAEFVTLLDSQPQASMVFSGSMQVSSKEKYARKADLKYITKLEQDYRYLFISNKIGAPSDVMYRRDMNVSFDEKSNWASDVFLYFEILRKNSIFVWTDRPLISIGIHDHQYTESFSKRDKRVFEDYRYMYCKYELTKSAECRDYFLKTCLLPYHKNSYTAGKCGYQFWEYEKQYLPFIWNDIIVAYSKAVFRKVMGILKRNEKSV